MNKTDILHISNPCSLFVVIDNTDLHVISSFWYPVSSSLSKNPSTLTKAFSEMDIEYKKFKDFYLENKNYIDLPEYSFLRFDIVYSGYNSAIYYHSREWIQEHMSVLLAYLTEKISFKAEYEERVKKQFYKTDSLNLGLYFEDEYPDLIKRASKLPQLTDDIAKQMLDVICSLSPTTKGECIKAFEQSQSYMLNEIQKHSSVLSLNRLHILDVIINVLKEPKYLTKLSKLYNLQTSVPIFFPIMDLDSFPLIAQVEQITSNLYYTAPFDLKLPDSFIQSFLKFQDQFYRDYPRLIDKYQHLYNFIQLSEINKKIAEYGISSQLHNQRNKLILQLVEAETKNLSSAIGHNQIQPYTAERFNQLQSYIFSLDESITNCQEELIYKIYLLEQEIFGVNSPINFFKYEPCDKKTTKNNCELNLNSLHKNKSYCLYLHNPAGFSLNSGEEFLTFISKSSESRSCRLPSLSLKFKISSSYYTEFPYNVIDFCNDLMSKLDYQNVPYIVTETPNSINTAETTINILTYNVGKRRKLIHSSIGFLKAMQSMDMLRKSYLLPIISYYSVLEALKSYLKVNTRDTCENIFQYLKKKI